MRCVRESIGNEFHFQPKAVKFLMEVATRVTATPPSAIVVGPKYERKCHAQV